MLEPREKIPQPIRAERCETFFQFNLVDVVAAKNPSGGALLLRLQRQRTARRLDDRFTANGVDPNRNFPFLGVSGSSAWNSGRNRPGSAD